MIQKIFSITTSFVLAISTFSVANIISNNSQWTIRDMGTLSVFDQADIRECNSNGQALIQGCSNSGEIFGWAFWDPILGLTSIPSKSADGNWYNWMCVNRNGLVIGIQNRELITWDSKKGLQMWGNQVDSIAQCRNSELAVLTCKNNNGNSQICILENDLLSDITPSLNKHAREHGFNAGGWVVYAVNSSNMLLGRFYHYQKHPYKERMLGVSTHYFVKDGDNFYLIDYSNYPKLQNFCWTRSEIGNGGRCNLRFDDNGRVFFNLFEWVLDARNGLHRYYSLIWDCDNGLIEMDIPPNVAKFAKQEGLSCAYLENYLEDGTTIWRPFGNDSIKSRYTFEKEGSFWYLPLNPQEKPILRNLNKYPCLKMDFCYITVLQKKRGFVDCHFFEERHPFVIECN